MTVIDIILIASSIISSLAVVWGAFTVISSTRENQRVIKDQIKELKDFIEKLDGKHDGHESRISKLENEIKNIHDYGCDRREQCTLKRA